MPSPPTRPATISELAAAAAETSSSNSNGDLKNLLRRADGHRRTGGVYMARTTGGSSGTATSTDIGLDLERAFIEYARAATLIVETVPAHREYNTGLNAEQRANLKAVS
jgi:STAM-binding protein